MAFDLLDAIKGIFAGQGDDAITAAAGAGGGGGGTPPGTTVPGQAPAGAGGLAAPQGGAPAAPGMGQAPPDMTSLYTKLLADQKKDRDIDRGFTLLAAGLGPKSSRPALIQAGMQMGTSGDQAPSSQIEMLMKIDAAKQAAAMKAQQAARLPFIAKQYGLPMETVSYLNDSGKLNEVLAEIAKPHTQVTTRADGSIGLYDTRTGKQIGADIGSAKVDSDPQIKEITNPDGSKSNVVIDRYADNPSATKVPGADSAAQPTNEVIDIQHPDGGTQKAIIDKSKPGSPAMPIEGTRNPLGGAATSDIINFNKYKQDGGKLDFDGYQQALRKSSANNISINSSAENAEQSKIGGARGDIVVDAIKQGDNAKTKLATMQQMTDAFNAGGDNIHTGPFADYVLNAKQGLGQMFGVNFDSTAPTEVVKKLGFGLATSAVKEISPRPSQMEFVKGLENVPGLALSKEGNRALISLQSQDAQNKIALGKIAIDSKSAKEYKEREEAYLETHPLISPFTGKAFGKDDIKILTDAGKAAVAAGSAQPIPGVGEVRQGYKFKGGDPNSKDNWIKQ